MLPTARRLLRTGLLLMAAVTVGAFAWVVLAQGGEALEGRGVRDLALPLALATLASATIPLLLGSAWMVLVEDATPESRPARGPLFAAFLLSWSMRYVPGKLPALASRVYLGAGFGAPRRALVVATGIDVALEVLVGGALGALLLLFALGLDGDSWRLGAAAAVTVSALVLMHPKFAAPLLSRLLIVTGRDPVQRSDMASGRALVLASLLIVAAQLIGGLGTLALLEALTPASLRDAAFVTGATSVAGVLGMLVAVAPAGLGVRDGATTALLGLRFATGPAAIAAILMRACSVVADASLLAIALGYDLATGRRLWGRFVRGASAEEARPVARELPLHSGGAE